MATLVINVDVEFEDGAQAKLVIKGARDGQGTDITQDFTSFCRDNQMPFDTQEQIETAVVHYAKANRDCLP